MSVLAPLAAALASGRVRVIDLTHTLDPDFPVIILHGAGRYGLQCLANLDLLPPTGAVLMAAPLKIKGGTGSPLRVLAMVEDA